VNAYGSYSTVLGKRLAVTKADGFGGGVEGRISLSENIKLNLSVSFERYSVQQDSALARWNWRFWNERYQGIVRDNLASDPTLRATLDPVQYMELLPVLASISVEVNPLSDLSVRQSVGGGVVFYTRSLYLNETWQKRFDAASYTFEYSYRNFAQDKKGNPLVVVGSIELAYRITDVLALSGTARYTSVIRSEGSFGYDGFPLNDALAFYLGLSFLY
jgi:hypothetical protein